MAHAVKLIANCRRGKTMRVITSSGLCRRLSRSSRSLCPARASVRAESAKQLVPNCKLHTTQHRPLLGKPGCINLIYKIQLLHPTEERLIDISNRVRNMNLTDGLLQKVVATTHRFPFMRRIDCNAGRQSCVRVCSDTQGSG